MLYGRVRSQWDMNPQSRLATENAHSYLCSPSLAFSFFRLVLANFSDLDESNKSTENHVRPPKMDCWKWMILIPDDVSILTSEICSIRMRRPLDGKARWESGHWNDDWVAPQRLLNDSEWLIFIDPDAMNGHIFQMRAILESWFGVRRAKLQSHRAYVAFLCCTQSSIPPVYHSFTSSTWLILILVLLGFALR